MDSAMITAIGALIVGIASIISAILLKRKTVALLEYRMEQVERKLDASNDTDRLARIETDIAVIKTSMELADPSGQDIRTSLRRCSCAGACDDSQFWNAGKLVCTLDSACSGDLCFIGSRYLRSMECNPRKAKGGR